MPKNNLNINAEKMYEWLCSTGYLLPSTEFELARFELLYPREKIKVNALAIDPFTIMNGTRVKKKFSWGQPAGDEQEQTELRMAARRHTEIPDHILARIKKNQQKDDTSDRSENPKGDE